MPRPPSRAGLNDTTQRELCWHLAQGASREQAARLAGLPDHSRLEHFARTKDFADQLRSAVQDHLATNLAPRAIQILKDIMDDAKVNPRVRVDACKVILDRSGYSASDAPKSPVDKPIAERSLAELHALVAKLEGGLKVVEGEVSPDKPPQVAEAGFMD